MLFFLSFLPALALIHFWRLFHSARLVTTKNPPQPISSVWDWSALTSLDDPARICTDFNTEPSISCEGNITILPGLEATLFAVVTASAVAVMALHWRAIFRRQIEKGATPLPGI